MIRFSHDFFSGQHQVTQYEGWRLLTFGRWFNTISSFWSRCKSSKWEKTSPACLNRITWLWPRGWLGVFSFQKRSNDSCLWSNDSFFNAEIMSKICYHPSPPLPWRLRLSWILIPLLTVACSFVFLGDTVLLPDDLWDWNIQIYLPHFTITYSHSMDGVFLWYMQDVRQVFQSHQADEGGWRAEIRSPDVISQARLIHGSTMISQV